MALRVIRRKDTGTLQITGTVAGRRVRRRAQTDDRRLAKEEATDVEARILRTAWHGKRATDKSFAEATTSYLKAEPRADGDKRRINRILRALGDVALSEIDQERVDEVRDKVLRPNPSPATVRRSIIMPIRAIMLHAHRRKWCDRPSFEIPKQPAGRTLYLLPSEAERLIAAAAPHLKPLFVLLLCTGARLSEALELDWREVDLKGWRVTFWTKGRPRRRRVVALKPRARFALAALPHREGPVFLWETKRPKGRAGRPPERDGQAKRSAAYADLGRQSGGQVSTGWEGAVRRAGLNVALTPHDLRHTWASWHYALNRDLLLLKVDGQWSSVTLVERYAHLMPAESENEIRAFWHGGYTETALDAAND